MEHLTNDSNNHRTAVNNVANDLKNFIDAQLEETNIIQDQVSKLLTRAVNKEELQLFFLNQHVEQLELSRRVCVALLFNSIDRLDDLTSWTPKKLLKLPMIGQSAVAEIQQSLKKLCLSLA
mgnify:CR=1 FL=1